MSDTTTPTENNIVKFPGMDQAALNSGGKLQDGEDILKGIEDIDELTADQRRAIANPVNALSSMIFNHKPDSGQKGGLLDLVLKYREKIPENNFNAFKESAQAVLDHNYKMLTERTPAYEASKEIEDILSQSKEGAKFESVLEDSKSNPKMNEMMADLAKAAKLTPEEFEVKVKEAHKNPMRYQKLAQEVASVQEMNPAYANLDFNQVIEKERARDNFRALESAAINDIDKLSEFNAFIQKTKDETPAYASSTQRDIVTALRGPDYDSDVTKLHRDLKEKGPSKAEIEGFKTSAALYDDYAKKTEKYASSADKSDLDFSAGLKAINEQVVKHSEPMKIKKGQGDESESMEESIEKIAKLAENILKMFGLGKLTQ